MGTIHPSMTDQQMLMDSAHAGCCDAQKAVFLPRAFQGMAQYGKEHAIGLDCSGKSVADCIGYRIKCILLRRAAAWMQWVCMSRSNLSEACVRFCQDAETMTGFPERQVCC